MRPTVPELLNKLVTHGSVEQIADYLQQEGVTGVRENEGACVIAEYVKARADVKVVEVLPNGPGYYDCSRVPAIKWSSSGGEYTSPLPDVLNELAMKFDNDEFPELGYIEEDL